MSYDARAGRYFSYYILTPGLRGGLGHYFPLFLVPRPANRFSEFPRPACPIEHRAQPSTHANRPDVHDVITMDYVTHVRLVRAAGSELKIWMPISEGTKVMTMMTIMMTLRRAEAATLVFSKSLLTRLARLLFHGRPCRLRRACRRHAPATRLRVRASSDQV